MRRHKRLRDGFAERLVPPSWPFTRKMQVGRVYTTTEVDLWIQAASGGEAYLARELLRRIAASGTRLSVLCTTCTAQGMEVLRRAQGELLPEPPWDTHEGALSLDVTINFLPLDEPVLMRRALRQAFGLPLKETAGREEDAPAPISSVPISSVPAPCASLSQGRRPVLVLLETEIWPGLLAACREVGVRVLILNARMTEGSFKGYRLLRSFLRREAPYAILATGEDDLRRFSRVFDASAGQGVKNEAENDSQGRPETVDLVGPPYRGLMHNIKFDRLIAAHPSSEFPEAPRAAAKPLLLASVRQEEEADLLRVITGIFQRQPDAALVVAPRHLHRAAAWAELLGRAGIAFTRCSCLADARADGLDKSLDGGRTAGADAEGLFRPGQVALWDLFGEMDYLYRRAGAVFVGGSLAPLGGQNFLEPLAFGLTPCIGPSWSNFYWAGRELFERKLVRQVRQAEELPELLLELARHPEPAHKVAEEFNRYLEARRGGTARAVQLILRALSEKN